jgi:hypothetical protein
MYQDVGLSYTGYFFVGLTTFVLAYVTINDTTSIDRAPNNSAAKSIIPTAISKPISEITASVESLNPFAEQKPVMGGKKQVRKTKRRR